MDDHLDNCLDHERDVERTWIHQGKILSFAWDRVVDKKDKTHAFELVIHPGAVAIVPITQDNQIILIKQWRHAAHQALLELPAGTLEKEEKVSVCAQRELREETGYAAHRLIQLGGFFSAPGFLTEYISLFLGMDLYRDPLFGDDTEEIESHLFSLDEVINMIDQHQIVDAKTIAGIYYYQRFLARKT